MYWLQGKLLLLLLATTIEAYPSGGPVFTRMVRLTVPLEPGQNFVEVKTDPVFGKARLVFSRPGRKTRFVLQRQLEAAGIVPNFSEVPGSLQVEFQLPFANLQARVHRKQQLLKIDLGEGRYMLPYRPRLAIAVRLPSGWSGVEQLIQAESDWDAGNLESAESKLREIYEKGSGSSSELACILLSDLLAEREKFFEAARTAAGCVEKALQFSSPLRALAEIKLIAYGGDLSVGESPILYNDQPYQTPELKWLGEEILFQRARLHLARGQYMGSASLLMTLLRSQPGKTLYEPSITMLRDLMLRIQLPDKKESLTQYLAKLVEAISLFPPESELLEELVEKAGRLLVDSGAYLAAGNIILWRLKNHRQSEVNARLLTILTEALIELGEVVRAEKTLAFLLKASPGAVSENVAFLSARVLEMKNRTAAARVAYQQSLKGSRGEEAFIRSAALCDRDENCWSQLLGYVERQPREKQPWLLLYLGQKAYQSGHLPTAQKVYEKFALSWPDHEYCPLAAYRLLKLSNKVIECRPAPDASESARLWASAWNIAKGQIKSGRKKP